MTVDAIGQATTLGDTMTSFMTGDDFLQLFAAQLQYQDPTAPMTNSELMQQVSQITQLQTISDLKKSMESIIQSNQLLQASGLIDRTVEYTNAAGAVVQGKISDVRIGTNGAVTLGLENGVMIKMDSISRVM
jgi:flagellar basal-body rod modification protein FlgD